jgi:hypothetical protein
MATENSGTSHGRAATTIVDIGKRDAKHIPGPAEWRLPQRHPELRFLFESLARFNHHYEMARLPDLRTLKFDPAWHRRGENPAAADRR